GVVVIEWHAVMPRVVVRRGTPQTVGFHFAHEEIEGARSYARGRRRDRQRSRRESRRKDNRIANAVAAHFGRGRCLDRDLAAGQLRRFEKGNALFDRAADGRRFTHRKRARSSSRKRSSGLGTAQANSVAYPYSRSGSAAIVAAAWRTGVR